MLVKSGRIIFTKINWLANVPPKFKDTVQLLEKMRK